MPITNLECCANSIQSALNGIKAGASRIELCQNLEQGGITPSNSEIIKLRELSDIKIHILILPKANQFQYTKLEFQQILIDIQFCKNLKCDGVVIGALNPNLSVNKEQTKLMVLAAKPMKVTFHRAFDCVLNMPQALEDIISCKCDYILTSGQKENVIDGIENLQQIVKLAKNRINIIAGGGVNHNNIESLYKIGIREFHLSGKELVQNGQLETKYENVKMAVQKVKSL
jgi:copper homeostasis protein|tara:strand:- start:5926 stop:6612 length:687 start_codon:yes stop_codon:yes gene_type:complete